jgi:hypothetical protein
MLAWFKFVPSVADIRSQTDWQTWSPHKAFFLICKERLTITTITALTLLHRTNLHEHISRPLQHGRVYVDQNECTGWSCNIIALNDRKYHPAVAIDNDRGAKLMPLCIATWKQLKVFVRLPIKHMLFCTCFQIVFPSCVPSFQVTYRSPSSVPFVAWFLIYLTISLEPGSFRSYSRDSQILRLIIVLIGIRLWTLSWAGWAQYPPYSSTR